MTPQEQQMIDGLIGRVRATEITDRDPDAAARLQRGLGDYPDALYVLAQTVLVQQNALEQAHRQMDELESQLQPPASAPPPPAQPATSAGWAPVASIPQPPAQPQGWLSRFFGGPQTPQSPTGYPPPQYAAYPPQNPYGQPQYGGGSFLRSAAQTAAGVAAGELLFSGVEGMFGGHHEGYGGGGGTTIINEYGDRDEHEHERRETGSDSDSSFYNPKDDASRDGGSRNFADTDDSNAADDNSDSTDDDSQYNFDDSSSDDSGSYDDGGDSSSDS